MTKLTIIMRTIGEIAPASYNPRDISEASFEGLKESLRKFGMVEPLIFNTRTQTLVGGHQRLKAAEAIGWTQVPVVEVDLSLAEEKALNVTLNNQTITGYFTEGLQSVLDEIRMDLGDDFMAGIRLDELVIPDSWDDGKDEVEGTEENLDGIVATIKIKCPQDIADEVRIYIQRKLLETSFEGVTLV